MIGYIYKTKFGTFSIFPEAAGKWRLEMDGRYCSGHPSAAEAAESVFNCASGHIDWDGQGDVATPKDISEWRASRAK